ncbi:uncharacterized protein [Choristoneura fumiferana]|uniref:uncharacterized protein n=1 Tax=Choristoneura fumiferana TaxID=7141 RepID=UPI003D15DA9E
MRLTWYIFGVFIIFTLGDVCLVNTRTLDTEAGIELAPAIQGDVLIITRFKRDDKLSYKKDELDKTVLLKEKKLAFKQAIEKKQEAIKAAIQKNKAAIKEFIQKKNHVIQEKKKKIVNYLSDEWAEIRGAVKEKYKQLLKRWKNCEVIYDRILKIFREALLEHIESTCISIKTKLRHKRQAATALTSPTINNTANTTPGPASSKERVQPQKPQRRSASTSSSGAASNAKSQATTNVIIDTKPKKSPVKEQKKLLQQILEIIREVLWTKVVLSLVDGAKAEYRSMKEKCSLALKSQNQYPEGFVRIYQQPYNPSVHQEPCIATTHQMMNTPNSQQQDQQPHIAVL